MIKLCTLGGATVCGYVGWALADQWGMLTAFVVSSIASLLGVWLGWKLGRRIER